MSSEFRQAERTERVRPAKLVLIVDRSADGREVLSIGLVRRGVTTLTTASSEDAQRVLSELVPDLVLVDADTAAEGSPRFLTGCGPEGASHDARWMVVTKPYHYRPLIRRIVEMLDDEHPTPVDHR